jgi:hypothetical protein
VVWAGVDGGRAEALGKVWLVRLWSPLGCGSASSDLGAPKSHQGGRVRGRDRQISGDLRNPLSVGGVTLRSAVCARRVPLSGPRGRTELACPRAAQGASAPALGERLRSGEM